jgi:hypothetical protein
MAKTKASGSLGDRCKCGWAVGANTSGDCVLCNDAIAKLPRRRMRPEATEQRLDDDDAFEQDKVSLKPPIKSQKTNTLSKAAQQQAADLRLKQDADLLLQGNGFARATVVENGSQHAGLVSEDWFTVAIPRDGHCLIHCFVGILKGRHPDHVIQSNSQMRECLAQYFEAYNNALEIDGVGVFSCESIDSFRSGRDKNGGRSYYGGIPECVAFSYRFSISLAVYAPESMDGVFICRGGGPTDFAPEVLLQSLGWRGNRRSSAADHWQRMISVHQSVLAHDSIAPNQNVIVTAEGSHSEAKLTRSLQCSVSGASESLQVVYVMRRCVHF